MVSALLRMHARIKIEFFGHIMRMHIDEQIWMDLFRSVMAGFDCKFF